MNISDLYQIARLSNRIDENGYIGISFTHKIDSFFQKYKDIFLIFKDYSVRYVTIDDVKYDHGYKIKILEKELYDEIISDGKVKVCLEKREIPNLPPNELYPGFRVLSNDGFSGEITDVLTSKFNEIFVIVDNKGKEFNLPNIGHFIEKIDKHNKVIYIKNYQDILESL